MRHSTGVIIRTFRAGETFYEPTGCLHRVSKNPAHKGKTRLIAFVLHPRDAKEVAIPEQNQGIVSVIRRVIQHRYEPGDFP